MRSLRKRRGGVKNYGTEAKGYSTRYGRGSHASPRLLSSSTFLRSKVPLSTPPTQEDSCQMSPPPKKNLPDGKDAVKWITMSSVFMGL